MGLSSTINRIAAGGARVLLVEVPGWAHTRVAAEQAVSARGWRSALSPADADVLLVCGRPGDAMRTAIDRLWAQVPGPAARVDVAHPDQLAGALHRAATVLLHHDRSSDQDLTSRPDPEPERHPGGREMPAPAMDQDNDKDMAAWDESDPDPGDTDLSAEDMSGHDMDMDMDMPMPGGIGLAGGGQDRDGLEMDVLSVPLGPVLPQWPAGLVLRCVLHGDVIASARTELLSGVDPGAAPMVAGDPGFRAAWDCDAVARLLALAGRPLESAGLRRIRDDLLAGCTPGDAVHAAEWYSRRVRRSRLLRWSLRGLGRISERELVERGLPAELAGDVHDRLLTRLDGIAGFLRSGGGSDVAGSGDEAARARAVVDLLPAVVVGLDLAAVRLVVASVAPDVAAAQRLGSTRG